MARVFISFVHEDEPVAMAVQALIAHELELGDEVFLSADRRQVFGGDIWLDKIRAALNECEVLVLMLSKRSLRRSWVNFEAGGIWLTGRPVIPVCFGSASKHHLDPPYASMQALDLPKDAGYLIFNAMTQVSAVPITVDSGTGDPRAPSTGGSAVASPRTARASRAGHYARSDWAGPPTFEGLIAFGRKSTLLPLDRVWRSTKRRERS